MTTKTKQRVMGILGAALLAPALYAAESPAVASTTETATSKSSTALEELWTRDKLTGDWGGVRTDLSKRGVDIDLRLSQYWQSVTSGGVNKNDEYGGTVDYRLNFDFGKLGLWKGGSVNMHARTRFGQDVNADTGAFALQNAGMLMPLPGDYNGTDITGLMFSQYLPFFGGLANVTLGKLDVIDTVTGFFPWVGYGQEGFWNANGMVSVLPWFGAVQGLSLYGGYGLTVNEKYQQAQTGFLVLGTQNESTSWGSVSDAFDEGAWLAGFHTFMWGDPKGKAGWLMVFAGYSTREQASNDPNDFIIIPGQGIENTEEKNPWDVAVYLVQDVWQAPGNPKRKVTWRSAATVGPDNPQFAQWTIFSHVEAYGLMASRPDDRMGVSGWYSGLSDNFTDLVFPVVDLRDTWGMELHYNFAINKWLHLSPDLQFVRNARKADDTAVILGARLVIDF